MGKPRIVIRRQPLKNDPATIGSGPAMCSASQKEIKVGDVLYETAMDSRSRKHRSDDEDLHYFTVTAHRVIQVNYQHRWVRIRCANGCETTIGFGGSECPNSKYWHDMADVRKELAEKAEKQLKCEQVTLKDCQWRVDQLTRLKKSAATFNVIKIPAQV